MPSKSDFIGFATLPGTGAQQAPVYKSAVVNRNYKFHVNRWEEGAVTIRLQIEDGTRRGKTIYRTVFTGYDYELPKENPFSAVNGYIFKGWSYSPNGPLITEDTIKVSADTTLYGVCDVLVTLHPNHSNDAPIVQQIPRDTVFALPAASPFSVPNSRKFSGWVIDGRIVEPSSVLVIEPMTFYSHYTKEVD